MQHGQSLAGFDERPCVEFHASATGEKNLKGIANAVMACDRLSTGNKNCTRLVQRQSGFDIPCVEGALEKEANLLWRGRGHLLTAMIPTD